MELSKRAREAYKARFDENTIEDSLAFTAAQDVAHAKASLDEDIAKDPFNSANKEIDVQGIISSRGGATISEEEQPMHGLDGNHVNEEAEYYIFEDGSMLTHDEDGNMTPLLFGQEREIEQEDVLYPEEYGEEQEREVDVAYELGR